MEKGQSSISHVPIMNSDGTHRIDKVDNVEKIDFSDKILEYWQY
jgi:hypothetical protein